ncbi:MAG: acyl-CoA dehydrogenase family protein [Dehalococcoidia bacterium]|nr:acyl-CoA dehydrogenase family protein [Dehalococcoidia bacterium]
MDFLFTAEEEAFRREVQDFLKEELPKSQERTVLHGGETDEDWEFTKQFSRKLGEKGWIAIWWPREYGGLEGSDMQYLIFNEESAYHRAPRLDGGGTGIVGPTILSHGTEEQKKRFLPPIARGEVMWIQCFSEPDFGSDSAGIKTTAVENGDCFVINGQKTWISFGLHGDFCYMTTRTDPEAPKHRGISYFLVDMKTPGITVSPITNMVGANGFCEVYFDNVRVPKENMLGGKNQGWMIMMTTLSFERGTLAFLAGSMRRLLDDLVIFANEASYNGQPLAKDPIVRQKLADIAIGVQIARLLTYRTVWMQGKGFMPTYQASMSKLFSDEMNFEIARVGTEIMGLYGQLAWKSNKAPFNGVMAGNYLNNLGCLFAGGTPEIQRTIMATIGLGLPRH